MPQVKTEQDFELFPAGPATVQLVSVEEREMDKFDKSGKELRWLWNFKKDPASETECLTVFTRDRYGNSRATLTILLDMLVPGITKDEAGALDTNTLVGSWYETLVKHSASKNDANKLYAEASYFKPLDPLPVIPHGAAAQPNPAPPAVAPSSQPALPETGQESSADAPLTDTGDGRDCQRAFTTVDAAWAAGSAATFGSPRERAEVLMAGLIKEALDLGMDINALSLFGVNNWDDPLRSKNFTPQVEAAVRGAKNLGFIMDAAKQLKPLVTEAREAATHDIFADGQ